MSYTLTTAAKILGKAGSGVNSTLSGSTILSNFCDDAEGTFCARTRKDWIANAGSTVIMSSISDAVSSLAAVMAIQYDLTGFANTLQAQSKMDVLTDNAEKIIAFLVEEKNKSFN